MPMKNPPHPGETVREDVIAALGLNITQAAEILGVRRATLSDLCNGKAALTADMALRLEKAFGVSMDLLLYLQTAYDAAQARARADEVDVRAYEVVRTTEEIALNAEEIEEHVDEVGVRRVVRA